MTPEEQRIKIAEWCGWKYWKIPHPYGHLIGVMALDSWPEKFGGSISDGPLAEHQDYESPPDYLNDLNAIHEAEIRLSPEEWGKYVASLASNEDDQTFALVHATAKQKTKSLVVAIGKWTATDQRKDK